MSTAKVFRSGNSQAVRLPKEFRLKTAEVEIYRRGNEIILREKSDDDMRRALALIRELPEDVLLAAAEEPDLDAHGFTRCLGLQLIVFSIHPVPIRRIS